jgi:hypothetical protein
MKINKRLTYSNVTATLALVFAMSGGALAANHYLITSTKQISPKVLKKLTGKAGPSGAPGAPGKEGPQGKEGAPGKEGVAGSAVAYAHVSSTGVLDTSHSKNVSTASVSGTGIFCLKVTVPVSNVSSTVDTGNSEGIFGFASGVLAGQDPGKFIATLCPEGDNVLVGIAEHKGENKSMAFWVNFN